MENIRIQQPDLKEGLDIFLKLDKNKNRRIKYFLNPVFNQKYGYQTPSPKSTISYLLLKDYYRNLEKNHKGLSLSDLKAIRHENNTCFYCGKTCSHNEISIDHFRPVSRGGKNLISNLRISCGLCNKIKGSINPIKNPTTYKFFLKLAKRKKSIPKNNITLLHWALKYLFLNSKEKRDIKYLYNKEVKRVSQYNKKKYLDLFS